MSTIISESVTLQLLNTEEGCAKFQIWRPHSGSDGTLVTTLSSSDFIDGVTLSGSDNSNFYELICLDSSNVAQASQSLSFCSSSTNLPDEPCDGTKTYTGNEVFPAVYVVPLGTATGQVDIIHNSRNIPDKFVIDWSGSTVFNSGYVGSTSHQGALDTELTNRGYPTETITNTNPGNVTATIGPSHVFKGFGSGSFQKNTADPTFCTVRVYGPLGGTAWDFQVQCPSGSVDTNAVVGDFLTIPAGGGSCLGGTTSNEAQDDVPSSNTTVNFTVSAGHTVTVNVTGSMISGFLANTASAELLDNNDNIIQKFRMYHPQGGTTSYSPTSVEVTGSNSGTTTYKLKVYSVPTDDGNGNIGLFVNGCTYFEYHETGINHTVLQSAGSNPNARVKVVWPQTDSAENYEKAIDARELTEFLTGRSSVTANSWYYFDSDIVQAGGLKIFDEGTGDWDVEKGDITLTSASQVKYWNENPVANELVIEMKNVSAAGDIAAGSIPLELYRFRYK